MPWKCTWYSLLSDPFTNTPPLLQCHLLSPSLPTKHSSAVLLTCFLLDTCYCRLCTLLGLIIVLRPSLHVDDGSMISSVFHLLSTIWMVSSYLSFSSSASSRLPSPLFSMKSEDNIKQAQVKCYVSHYIPSSCASLCEIHFRDIIRS